MHADKRAEKITGTGGKDKAAVMGILERGPKSVGSKVRVKVIDNAKKKTLQSEIQDHVLAGSAVFTDALKSYEGLDEFHDGVVLAADSASMLTVGVPQQPGSQPAVGVLNVYDNANKIFNLYKGKPIGCITFGSGSIGNASIATLVKDLRFKLTKGDVKLTNGVIKFDPKHYAIVQVAEILARFLDEECANVSDAAERKGINMGFLLGGYSSDEPLGESWSVEIKRFVVLIEKRGGGVCPLVSNEKNRRGGGGGGGGGGFFLVCGGGIPPP